MEKSKYVRCYLSNERTTVVIGPDGRVRDVRRKLKPGEHDRLVLEALSAD